MLRSQRLNTLVPAAVLIVLLLLAAVAMPQGIASAIRHVFAQSTLLNLTIVCVVAAAVALTAPRLPNALREHATAHRVIRYVSNRRQALAALVDRTPWPLSVSVLAVAGGACWYSLSRAVAVPQIFADELIYVTAARRLAEGHIAGLRGYGITTPALDSLAYLVTADDVSSYRLIQVINVAVVMTAAFPAYLLAQRVLSRPWALTVAGLTVATPWIVYTRFVMTEAAFYPVFLLFVLALVRALERPTFGRQLSLAAALGLAFATRTQAIVLVGAVVVAVVLLGFAQNGIKSALLTFIPTWVLYGVGGVIATGMAVTGAWKPLGAYGVLLHGWLHPRGLSLWVASNVTSLSLGLGFLVAGAFPLGAFAMLKRGASRGEQAVAAASVAAVLSLLLTVVVLSESSYGQGSVHERNFFFVAPLVFICAIAWARRGFPRPVLPATLTVVLFVGLALIMPAGPITGHSVDALSFKLWTQFDDRVVTPSQVMVVAVLIGTVVLLRMRSTWPLILTAALAALGIAAASDYRSDVPRDVTPRYAWVDSALPTGTGATLLWIGDAGTACPRGTQESELGKFALYSELFNSGITRVGHLFGDNGARGLASDAFSIEPGGLVTLNGAPLRPAFAVADARVRIVGSRKRLLQARDVGIEAAAGAALALWRVTPPLRLGSSAEELRKLGAACAS